MQKTTLPKQFGPFLWYFLKKQWKTFLAIQILAFAWSIDHTFWPYIIMLLIDGITNFTGDKSTMWSVLAIPLWMGGILWICVEVAYRTEGILLAKALPKLEANIRLAMFDYVQRHSHSYFSNNFSGSIANKISDMPQAV